MDISTGSENSGPSAVASVSLAAVLSLAVSAVAASLPALLPDDPPEHPASMLSANAAVESRARLFFVVLFMLFLSFFLLWNFVKVSGFVLQCIAFAVPILHDPPRDCNSQDLRFLPSARGKTEIVEFEEKRWE